MKVPVPPVPVADKFKVALLHTGEFEELKTLNASAGSVIKIGRSKIHPFVSFTLMVYVPTINEPKVPLA